MKTIDPTQTPIPEFHQILLGAVAPRPIAFASTIDAAGNSNIAPFSFFNAFGINPPTLIFSPARSGRTNIQKDTFLNIQEVPEVVIHVVPYHLVHQVSLASSPFPRGVDEYNKAGLTPIPSLRVRPFRVLESPVHFECKVTQIIETGNQGGAGNLIICEVLLAHIDDKMFGSDDLLDPDKLDLVGRCGKNYYSRSSGAALFEITKPITSIGIGIDQLPDAIRLSTILTGSDLAQLASVEAIPTELDCAAHLQKIKPINIDPHQLAHDLIMDHKLPEAWAILLTDIVSE